MPVRYSSLSHSGALSGNELLAVSRLSTTVTITSTFISADSTDNSFNVAGGGFTAAGFTAGKAVKVSGFTGSGANNIFSAVVTSVTDTKMIIGGADGDVIVTDAAGESVTISQWESVYCATDEIAALYTPGAVSSADVTYTPFDNTDWNSSADPGDVNDALDQLADRLKTVETSMGGSDASSITYTPGTLSDWNTSLDPGQTDDALDQLAARMKVLETSSPSAPDASTVTYTPAVLADWNTSADPGDVDNALDQLAERVKDIETAGPGGSTIGLQSFFFPASGMMPSISAGCSALAWVALGTNMPDMLTLDFQKALRSNAQFALTLPKKWDEGTIYVRFVWSHASTATNFGVRWGIEAASISDAENLAVAWSAGQEVADTGGTTDYLYRSDKTSALTVSGSPTAEDLIYFRVYREVSGTGDNLAVDARLHGVIIYYTTNAETDA